MTSHALPDTEARPFPSTETMRYTVALLAASGEHADLIGAGTHESPLLPVDVQLTGRDGNAFAIIAAVQKEARRWLRREPAGDDKFGRPLYDAIAAELMDAHSYTELLDKAFRLVRAH